MGLTGQSTGLAIMRRIAIAQVKVQSSGDIIVALAGNPNTGKSTVFNSLTGLKQHTGNWPGKTVTNACGRYGYDGKNFILVDLPGTYSLMANSPEEEVARDFICFGNPHVTVVVVDATCMERNLNLVFQIIEMTPKVVVCVNLMDEAHRKGIQVDTKRLSDILGVPVVGISALKRQGLDLLKQSVWEVACGGLSVNPIKIEYDEAIEDAVGIVEPQISRLIDNLSCSISSRWLALRLLEGDQAIVEAFKRYLGIDIFGWVELKERLQKARDMLVERGITIDQLGDRLVSSLFRNAEEISRQVVHHKKGATNSIDSKIDDLLTSRAWGIPAMLALLGLMFWITIQGANYPSHILSKAFFYLEEELAELFMASGMPQWLYGILIDGVYRTLSWVVSVMLPPMAIFFPLFTLLEDLGYLPRVAFNLDNFFKRACAHGKQALTMCMGFGCNAAGVVSCRIIDSPRERLIAIITNNYVPCNGRFPTLIALATIFMAVGTGWFQTVVATFAVMAMITLAVVVTLLTSKILSRTVLKGLPSSFVLELPPYRKPQVCKILIRSLMDRTLSVLARAVTVAAPAGLVIWVMANVNVAGNSLLNHFAGFLDPFARMLGLDGYILMAFILGLPANEIVIPIVLMSYVSAGTLMDLDSLEALHQILVQHGWTWLTALCTMLFSLNHFPCGTTLLTICKETGSWKWTLISFMVPTITGIVLCFVVAQTARLLGLV
ncbi:ferrous iron transport protein B [Caldicoprobacter algeriensis]|uniref:ferrous iron transport protein B n=1 Tax=Caldicoprobacter algeriensis TaxID=699281 RepID=UPI002079F76D|nr:ferrous iron transport protein B [Caldicoprobacter algeriensis]MCM8900940.1 ferrous iron transport protein B [Caldicoprobacter algeriensis]